MLIIGPFPIFWKGKLDCMAQKNKHRLGPLSKPLIWHFSFFPDF